MAYATGSTIGMQPCFDKIVETVMAAGWTLLDNLSATDKVFKSNGENNLGHHIMRLTIDDKVTHTSPAHYQNAQPHIVFRGYHAWDVTTHTGINEFGEFGPYIYSGPGGNLGRIEIGLPNAPSTLEDRYADVPEPYTKDNHNGLDIYLGERSILTAGMWRNDLLREWDIISGEYRDLPEPPVSDGKFYPEGAYTVVWDKSTDETYIYALNSNSNAPVDHFWRYSFNSNSWTQRAAPPWPATTAVGAFIIWDGRDTLYAGPGANTTHFAKYTISTDTWTALPALPLARQSGFGQIPYGQSNTFNCHQIYVPKESSGLTSDYIFMYLSITGGIIYSYEVETGTWGTRNLTHPYGASHNANRTVLLFDGKKTIWAISHASSTTAYKWDTTNLAAGPVAVPNFFRGTNNANTAALVDPYVARVRCHATEPYTYWIFANKDRVIVVTDVKGHQRWAYFGGVQSYYRNSMRITSAATAGLGVAVSVNDTTGYLAGDSVFLVDTTTGATEKTTIVSVVGPTSFTANLQNSYTVGSLVGTDPLTTIAAGSMCLAVAAMDANGYNTVGQSSSYKIAPLVTPEVMRRGLPSKRGNVYQPWPLILFNTVTKWPTYENRGSLDGVYAVQSGAYPAPQPLDEVSIDGKTYICFDMQDMRNVADKVRVLIGPRE